MKDVEAVIQILLKEGLVTEPQVASARTRLSQNEMPDEAPKHPGASKTRTENEDRTVIDVLIRQGTIEPFDVAWTLGRHLGMSYVDLGAVSISDEVIHLLTRDMTKRFQAIPVGEVEGKLLVAVADPLDREAMDALRAVLPGEVEFVCATPEAVKTAFRRYWGIR